MRKSSATTIQEYLDQLEAPQKVELARLIAIVKREVPKAEESISYGMPAFKFNGKPLIYFGAFNDHLSIFPTSGPIQELQAELKKYQTGKGTLQFTLDTPFPEELLIKLLQIRIEQIQS